MNTLLVVIVYLLIGGIYAVYIEKYDCTNYGGLGPDGKLVYITMWSIFLSSKIFFFFGKTDF